MSIIMEYAKDNDEEPKSLENKHRKEKKELQSQIQALKKAAKNDKTKKKELLAEITRLEISMENRHKQELEAFGTQTTVNEKNNDSGCVINDTNLENEVSKMKISKAQRRRDKKSQQEKEREELIKLQEKENLNGPRNLEIQEISDKLRTKNLVIYSIPSDGDCLYKAISHQLFLKRNQSITANMLRKEAAFYIMKHKDDFLPFMTNPDTFEMLNDEEFVAYCDKVANTTIWGSQLEIRALSSSLKCPINVIQATGPDIIEQGSEFDGPPLFLTYHRHMYSLGEHYNSTCVKESETDD